MAGERPYSEAELEDLFARADPAFGDALHDVASPEWLAAFAERWSADPRPAARQLLLAYLDTAPNPFHEPLIAALLARAEQSGDDILMGCLLVFFDRSVRRHWTTRPAGPGRFENGLLPCAVHAPPLQQIGNVCILPAVWGRERILSLTHQQQHDYAAGRLLSVSRRLAYRRRVLGYFRRLGWRDPGRYVRAALEALKRYTPADMANGIDLLSNRNLMHLLYYHSPVRRERQHAWPQYGWLPAPAASAPPRASPRPARG